MVDIQNFIKTSKDKTKGELEDLLIQIEKHYGMLDFFSYRYEDDHI